MSFLSRKPARPNGRGSGDEYDDFDDYADDGYAQSGDDGWSPNQYFSPEGIKGKWAGEHPAGRSGGRGRPDASQDSYRDEFDGHEYGGAAGPGGPGAGPGYGSDEFATGVYDLPEGSDEDRGASRRARRTRDREDRGERTGILRLRRDRGEDIWPDDGVSDEDYWASVAADRPFHGDAPLGDGPGGPGARPGSGQRPEAGAPRGDGRAGTGARPGPDGRPGAGSADSRFGGGERGTAGRLGPPPGLAADYQAAPVSTSGGFGGLSQPGAGRRPGSGPMPARPATGPHPVRPTTGPTPTVGVTSSRPPATGTGARPGLPASASSSGGFPKSAPPARPSFQPAGTRSGGLPGAGAGSRQPDWADRTERIERVTASGYPEPRPASRGQGPGGRAPSGPLGLGAGAPGPSGAPAGRDDNAAWRAPERQAPDRRAPGRDEGRESSGAWPAAPARGGAPARSGDDDPLTSKAYSRAAMTDTDGRSYRAAARRSQAQTQLTDQVESFLSGAYPQQPAQAQPAQAQSGRTGEYWQYRDDQPSPAPQPPGGRYQAPGGQVPGSQGAHPAQPGRAAGSAGAPGRGPAGPVPGRPAQPVFTPIGTAGRPGLPGGGASGSGLPSGPYEAQQRSSSQQQRPAARPQLPAAGPSGSPAQPAFTPVGSGSANGSRPAGAGGLNPYDSAITGSYPYASQSYPAPPAVGGGPAQGGADDPYYRPAPADGYQGSGTGQARADQSRPGYASGYPASSDRRY